MAERLRPAPNRTKMSGLVASPAGRDNSIAFQSVEANGMARAISDIERQIRTLEPNDQEHLLRVLLANP